MSRYKAVLLLPTLTLVAHTAQPYPLPLPKRYKIPQEIREIIVDLLKESKSVSEFKAQYKLRYQDKDELWAWLKDKLEDKALAILNSGEAAAARGDMVSYYASRRAAQRIMDGDHHTVDIW